MHPWVWPNVVMGCMVNVACSGSSLLYDLRVWSCSRLLSCNCSLFSVLWAPASSQQAQQCLGNPLARRGGGRVPFRLRPTSHARGMRRPHIAGGVRWVQGCMGLAVHMPPLRAGDAAQHSWCGCTSASLVCGTD